MPEPALAPEAKRRRAAELVAQALRADTEPGGHLDQLCAAHPELAEEFRSLEPLLRLAQSAAASRSFQQSLREQFGDDAEVTVRLEEGLGVAPSGGAVAFTERPVTSKPPPEGGAPNPRYALEGEVGRGGMGIIFRVRDRNLSRTLAMKIMPQPHPIATASQAAAESRRRSLGTSTRLGLARFLEEAQITAQLDHPNIVPVHEVGFDAQGQPFFTMKLVKGRDLNEILTLARVGEAWGDPGTAGSVASPSGAESQGSEIWNLPRAVGVMVKACQALAYAHSKGVIHRVRAAEQPPGGKFARGRSALGRFVQDAASAARG
jgi:hypothetical protein